MVEKLKLPQSVVSAVNMLSGNLLELLRSYAGIGLWHGRIFAGNPTHPSTVWTWSREFCEMLGLSYEEVTKDPAVILSFFQDRITPDDLRKSHMKLVACIADQTATSIYDDTHQIRMNDGQRRWFRSIATMVRDSDGVVVEINGAMIDVDAQRNEEERSQVLSTYAGVGLWDAVLWKGDPRHPESRWTWSDEFRRLLGFKRGDLDEFPNEVWSWANRLHPDDQENTWNKLLACLNDYSGITQYDVEYRLLMKDGQYRWFRAVGGALREDNGTPIRACGSLIDIHAIKLAEEDLRLAALVYEKSDQAMIVTDPDGKFITINPAFTRLTGYDKEEISGKATRILKAGLHDQEFYVRMWHCLINTGQWQGEIWSRKENGDIYPAWLSINTVYAENGFPSRRVALITDMTEQKKSQETIWRQANFDGLTGLPNRSLFMDRLEQLIKKSNREGLPAAVMFIDLDKFKDVNDSLGHEKGDLLLKDVARRIQSCVRETDTVGRLGGDEFTVIMADLDDIKNVARVTESILDRVAAPYDLEGEIASISASIGVTFYPNDADNVQGLLKNADQAMYESKRLGRNRFSYFASPLQ